VVGGGWNGVVFLLESGVGLRFAFSEGLRKSNGYFWGGFAKSVTGKNDNGKGGEVFYLNRVSSLPLRSNVDEGMGKLGLTFFNPFYFRQITGFCFQT
jgi:hypothetical protein